MNRGLYLPLASLFTALVCMSMQCRDEAIEYRYRFKENIDAFPVQKNYRVGDTIWVQYANPRKRLFDTRTNQAIDVDSVSIEFQISFNSRYNTPFNPIGGFCEYVVSNATSISRSFDQLGTGVIATFGCNPGNSLDFTMEVIPKQRGIYSLDVAAIPRTVSACRNPTSSFPISTVEYRFSNADVNKDVYLTIPPEYRRENTRGHLGTSLDERRSFVVRVE